MHRPIEAPLAREILRAMPEEHARRSNLYVDDELYVWEENAATLRYSQVAGVPMHVVGDLAELDRAADDQDRHRRARPRRWTRCATSCSRSSAAARSSRSRCRYFLEFAAPGVSKASGLALVADLLGFTAEQAVAVGDAENDREMLEWARWGSRSRTPTSACIGEADAVIPSVHEDGVAQLLEALAAARPHPLG